MKWTKDSHAFGECGEYMITEALPDRFNLYVRDVNEKAYAPLGTFTTLEKAKWAAERSG